MLETLIQGVVPEPINAQGTNDSLFLIFGELFIFYLPAIHAIASRFLL